jgi:exodeoxyribonuclease V beta subunit
VAELSESAASPFTVEDVSRPSSAPDSRDVAALAAFRPSAEWFAPTDAPAHHAALRRAHAGTVLTSYTRMKSERGGARGAWSDPARLSEEDAFERHGDDASLALLRATRSSGVFLHEILERVPLASFASAGGDPASWAARDEVRAVVDEAMAVHRVEPSQRGHAERIVWSAYTTATVLPSGASIAGFAAASYAVREMPFVYASGGAEAGGRVFVRGSVDLAFEHEGLVYFVDWKSDALRSYRPDALAQRVVERYEEQLRLYAIAVTRLLGVDARESYERRFGGILYCFLRGYVPGGDGLWSLRPSWDTLRGWADDLAVRSRSREGSA